jgi:hypothetical protein
MKFNPPAHKISSDLLTSLGSPHRSDKDSETSIPIALLILPTWDPVAEILMSSRTPVNFFQNVLILNSLVESLIIQNCLRIKPSVGLLSTFPQD